MKTMSIVECEDKAKDEGFDRATFDLVSPAGKRFKCRWLDAYIGSFIAEGQEGFWLTDDVKKLSGIYCENFAVPERT